MKTIEHPDRFREGCRVLFMKGRHKDGAHDQRMFVRVSHSAREFDRQLEELAKLHNDGERIYVSASARDVRKASRTFKERQLAAEYDDNPLAFYDRILDRWVSALMTPTNAAEKMWLFDCDTDAHRDLVVEDLKRLDVPFYGYPTKNGWHYLVSPFNRTLLSQEAAAGMDTNPLMLWAY